MGNLYGYTSNKSKLQKNINEYIEGDEDVTSFIDVEVLPEYSLCLAKRGTKTNDEEIFDRVKQSGVSYYQYYAIVVDNEEKEYVKTKKEAEKIINKLKEKKSDNIDKIAYTQINSTEQEEFADTESVVTALYVKPKPVITIATGGAGSAKLTDSSYKPALGISFIKPTSGVITATYRQRGYSSHTGLDIASSVGTPIYAAAGGTVVSAGQSGSGYGIYVKVSHGNGVETLYAHCSKIFVSKGQAVAQGQKIAAMGSTGRSTGNHLHFEIRNNGVALNPQNYVY